MIEERYVSGFGMHMPFNDARRLHETPPASEAVPFRYVGRESETRLPQRMLWANIELNSNSNIPEDVPGLFDATEVNQ